ncbi:MAG: T9SS type A sorting domain-containing protein [Flavobacteriales bacterium]|nr:T9SS type A sorting domain-containing protein [Flavobacteriales bacterium]
MKNLLIISFLLLLGLNVFGQSTAIPDANFEQALITLGLDTGTPNGTVLTSNIDTVTSLSVNSSSITDITGIEGFTALKVLSCYNNQLTILDMSQNTALIDLVCWSNQLTSLNVSQNTALTFLDCNNNQLASFDVTQNTALTSLICHANQLITLDVTQNTSLTNLECYWNQLTALDVSQNTLLTDLRCPYNQITCLNVKNGFNTNLTTFHAYSNPNLTCIEVDDIAYATSNWIGMGLNFYFDPASSFSTNCNNTCSSTTVGIKEIDFSKISFYPNPTDGAVTIDLKEDKQNVKATLTNSLGQIILSENYTSTNSINFNIETPKGVYFLQLEVDGEMITKKIMKQ